MRYMLLIRKAPPRCCQVSTLANTAIVRNQEHHQHHRNGEEQAVADEMSRCLGEPIEADRSVARGTSTECSVMSAESPPAPR